MDIATGQPEDHPTPLPLDASALPAVAPPTAVVGGQLTGPTVPAAVVSYPGQMAGTEAAAQAAQAAGHAAETARRQHYEAGMLPLGTTGHGDQMNLPPVPSNALPPADSYGYPYPGLEPTIAAAGFDDPAYGT